MIRKFNYLEWLESRGLRPRTIREYEYCLDNLVQFDKFNQVTVQKFIAKHKGNISRSFLKSYKAYLLSNPRALGISQEAESKIRFIDIPSARKKSRESPEVITEEEVITIYRNMETEETRLILLLSFYCGLRRETVLGLKAGMFDFERWENEPHTMGILRVVSKGNKKGRIPVMAKVMRKVYDYLPDDYRASQELFPTMIPRTWNNILGRVSKKCLGKRVKPHTLRHSIAMHLRGKGFDIDMIKEFLMHQDIGTTQIYARVTPEQLIEKFRDL